MVSYPALPVMSMRPWPSHTEEAVSAPPSAERHDAHAPRLTPPLDTGPISPAPPPPSGDAPPAPPAYTGVPSAPPAPPSYTGVPSYPVAPPSYTGVPSYPVASVYGYPPPQWYPYAPGYAPVPFAPPPRRSYTGLILGIVGGVVALCIVVSLLGVVALRAMGSGMLGAPALATPVPTSTMIEATPTVSIPPQTLYSDSLKDKPANWANDGKCTFKADGYHVFGGAYCLAPGGATPANVAVSVTAQAVQAGKNTTFGLVVRDSGGNDYSFEINTQGQWGIVKFTGNSGIVLSGPGESSAIKAGIGATNDLRVVAIGSQFTFYVNGQEVTTYSDSSYPRGDSGVINDDDIPSSDVIFTNYSISSVAA